MQLLRKALTWVIVVCFYGHTLVASAGTSIWISPAPSAADQGGWSEHIAEEKSGTLQNWIPQSRQSATVGPKTVYLPKDNYKIIATATWQQEKGDYNWDMIDGPRWITNNRSVFGKLGLTDSRQISDQIKQQPGNGPMVFAMYSPQTLSLRIAVQKVEKLPNGNIIVAVMDYTPHHGEYFRYSQNFLTQAELDEDPKRFGINPYAAFAGSNDDPVFHDISWAGVATVVGLTIKHQRALLGWIATSKIRNDVQSSSSGGLFSSTTKTILRTYAKPKWWLAGPVEMVPGGQHHSICVGPEAIAHPAAGCVAEERVANAGVLVSEWQGGGVPDVDEDLVYKWVNKQKSWTVLFYTVLTAFIVAGAGLMMSGLGGMGGAGGGFLGTEASAITTTESLGAGALAGGAYAVVSTDLFSDGGFTNAQDGFLGSINSGKLTSPRSSGHEARIMQGLNNKFILPAIESGQNLTEVGQMFGTECPLGQTVAQCKASGQDPGMGWRSDSYMVEKEVLILRNQYKRCHEKGYRGELLSKCTAPGRPDLLRATTIE